jgi:hypothetical protein
VDDAGEVWSLFADRKVIEERMTLQVHAMVAAAQAAAAAAEASQN